MSPARDPEGAAFGPRDRCADAGTSGGDALNAVARAERALGQFDQMLRNPRLRQVWWGYALAEEAAGLAWCEGFATTRARVRLLAAGAARGPFGPGDQRGYTLYRTLQKLFRSGKPGPKALSAAIGPERPIAPDATLPDAGERDADRAELRRAFAEGLRRLRRDRSATPPTVLAACTVTWMRVDPRTREHGNLAMALGAMRALAERGPWRTTPPLLLGWEGHLLTGGGRTERAHVSDAVRTACTRHMAGLELLVTRRRALLEAVEPCRRDSLLPVAADALVTEEVLTPGMLRRHVRAGGHELADRTARKLLAQLAERGLAIEATGRRHFRVYTYTNETAKTVTGMHVNGAPRKHGNVPLANLSLATRGNWRPDDSDVDLQQLFEDVDAAERRVQDVLARWPGNKG